MRKLTTAAAASLALLSTAGCTQIDLAQVQQATVAACGFLPTAIQVSQWFGGGAEVATAGQIAQVICDVVAAQKFSARRGGGEMISRTIRLPDGSSATVQGYFVR